MWIVTLLALFLGNLFPPISAFRDGPVPNTTGGFGEPSCRHCHLDNPLNAPGGRFSLAGVPVRYEPSSTHRFTVNLARENLQRGGFQIAARFASGDSKGKQAGVWRALDDRTQVVGGDEDPVVFFAQHTARGSLAATRGSMSWTLEWTAPAVRDVIEFSAAGNAANDDDSPLGDYIYVTAAHSSP